MNNDAILMPVRDIHDIELALAEIRKQLLPWLAQEVVEMLDREGVPRADIVPLASALVVKAYPMWLAAYEKRCAKLAAEMRADEEAGCAVSGAIMH